MAWIDVASDFAFAGNFTSDNLDQDSAKYEVLKALIEAAMLEQMKYAGAPEKPGPGDKRDE